jgi:membrane protein YqaA with SNARE-associated domain
MIDDDQLPVTAHDDCGCAGGCLGAVLGAILLPIGFEIYAWLVLHDPGGPLFWPILALAGTVLGSSVGVLVGSAVHRFRRNA